MLWSAFQNILARHSGGFQLTAFTLADGGFHQVVYCGFGHVLSLSGRSPFISLKI